MRQGKPSKDDAWNNDFVQRVFRRGNNPMTKRDEIIEGMMLIAGSWAENPEDMTQWQYIIQERAIHKADTAMTSAWEQEQNDE